MKRSLSARAGQGGLLLLAATALILSTTAGAYAPAASVSAEDVYDLPQLSDAENDLLNSDEPVTVVLDASSGFVVAVEEETNTSFGTLSVTQNNCSGGKSCWNSSLAPGAYYGFTPGGNLRHLGSAWQVPHWQLHLAPLLGCEQLHRVCRDLPGARQVL